MQLHFPQQQSAGLGFEEVFLQPRRTPCKLRAWHQPVIIEILVRQSITSCQADGVPAQLQGCFRARHRLTCERLVWHHGQIRLKQRLYKLVLDAEEATAPSQGEPGRMQTEACASRITRPGWI